DPNALRSGTTPGHAFLTLTKTNGGQSVTKSFGFYPMNGPKSLVSQTSSSKIVNDSGHEFDASLIVNNLSSSQFNLLMQQSIINAYSLYGLQSYNCTDFAIETINNVLAQPLFVADWYAWGRNFGTTPNGLYLQIATMSSTNPNAIVHTRTATGSINPCP
ncbi:MAG: hypothetical protein MUE72_11540, partial [Chitinophagaceae bacterium]|nr:hypothetical protein [Chitinophagaceae bacterium]